MFSWRCEQENLLKTIWKICSAKDARSITLQEIESGWHKQGLSLSMMLFLLQRRGWLKTIGVNHYELTPLGMLWGRKIVRLHRLWEVYLVEYCKVASDRVHVSAEEMEHVITPEIEQELNVILHHPKRDPHNKPIPQRDEDILLC